jgi:pimeloyl-ACP methyl ester carboxylesterase
MDTDALRKPNRFILSNIRQNLQNIPTMKINKHIFFISIMIFSNIIEVYSQNAIINGMSCKVIKINEQKFTSYKGFIDVHLNRDSNLSKMIKLPVLIIKSSNKLATEPVFNFDGGPGQSNISLLYNTSILENHDYVSIGYRGVDGSIKLKSKKIGKAIKGKHNKLLSDESLNNIELQMTDYLGFLKNKGIDLRDFTIMNVIEDMEYVRKVLGYSKINLYSFSYGTRVALLYSYKYPEVIRRSVMVGVNPPGHFVWSPQKTEEILNLYDSIYKSQNLTNYKGSIKEAMRKAFEKMPKRWSFFNLDADKIKCTAFVMLFKKDNAVMTFDAFFKAANENDYSGLYLMQLAYDYIVPGMFTWGDFFEKGVSSDFQSNVNYRDMLRSFNTTIGPNLSLLIWGCTASWTNYSIPDEYRKTRVSQTETLIISGNLDVSTPADYAQEELLPYLPNGRQVILKNMSHLDLGSCQYNTYNKFVSTYFYSGKVDESDFSLDDINFNPKKRFSTLAKTLYPITFIMSLIK